MSLLKSLFGLGKKSTSDEAPVAAGSREFNGYLIVATPMKAGHEFQVCGVISREIDGDRREHHFIRVDKLTSRDDCIELIFRKGEQMVAQMGDRIFE